MESDRYSKQLCDAVKQASLSAHKAAKGEDSGKMAYSREIVTTEEYDAAIDQNVLDFVNDALEGKLKPWSKVEISRSIPNALANKIGDIVGLDITGYGVEYDANQLPHVKKRHMNGSDNAADHSVTPEDIAKLKFILDNFTDVKAGLGQRKYKNSDNTPAKTVEVQTQVGDGYIYTVVATPDTKAKMLKVITEYKNKKNTFSEVAVPNGSGRYVQDGLQTNVFSDLIISSSSENASRVY